MQLFRLTKSAYANQFNGKGAANSNNRWNTKGTEIIYTAESRALALAEILVHLPLKQVPPNVQLLTIDVPAEVDFHQIHESELQIGWNQFPPLAQTQQIGDLFFHEKKFALLKVPSAVVQGDYNVLINPYHEDFKKITITSNLPFPIDNRFFM